MSRVVVMGATACAVLMGIGLAAPASASPQWLHTKGFRVFAGSGTYTVKLTDFRRDGTFDGPNVGSIAGRAPGTALPFEGAAIDSKEGSAQVAHTTFEVDGADGKPAGYVDLDLKVNCFANVWGHCYQQEKWQAWDDKHEPSNVVGVGIQATTISPSKDDHQATWFTGLDENGDPVDQQILYIVLLGH